MKATKNISVRNDQMKKGEQYLSIDQCPDHPEFITITIEDSGSGTRLLGSKCCGRTERQVSFKLDKEKLSEIIHACENAKTRLFKAITPA